MKKIFALLFTVVVLTSCGGSYTTDKEKALDMKKEQTEDYKSYYESALDIETDYYTDRKEILANYGGEESSLMKKAKTQDEDALDHLSDLRNLEIKRSQDLESLGRKFEDRDRALRKSISDIRMLNEAKALEAWEKSIEAEEKIQNDLANKHDEAVEKLRKK